MKNLLGFWMTDPEVKSEQLVTLEFTTDGQLIYTIMGEESDQVMLLTYRIENDIIITNQPSAPKEEKTRFSITPDDKLTLIYGNETHQYMRIPNIDL